MGLEGDNESFLSSTTLVSDCEAVGVNDHRPHGITPDNTLLVRG